MKNKITLALILVLAAALLALVGCEEGLDVSGVKVEFMLEGGTYQNGQDSVCHYYNFKEGTQNLIKPLQEWADDDDLVRAGYVLDGWYRTKNDDGSYSDEWDFQHDTVDGNGVKLYAKWKKAINFTYRVYDYDNPDELVRTQTVNEGVKFNNRYAARVDYTLLAVYDFEGNEWDSAFVHPGENGEKVSDTEYTVKVLAKYIGGTFTLVENAKQLSSAAALKQNIYLKNDIDMEGESLSFGSFRGKFYGNGHTVSNFTVYYSSQRADLVADPEDSSKSSLAISLFGIATDSEIRDVKFENAQIDVNTTYSGIYKIYVYPVATAAYGTTISNVSVSGAVKVTKHSTAAGVEIPMEMKLVATDKEAVFFADNNSSFENISVQMTLQDNSEVRNG